MPTARQFVAIDGESITENGEHKYIMLVASDGSHLIDRAGLSTAACLDFLLQLKSNHPTGLFVGFGFNYDVNMMLRDIPFPVASVLWDNARLRYDKYRMEWIPSKFFRVGRDKQSVLVNDTFGFFQSSFVGALEQWDIPDPEGHIARMKGARSDFKWSERVEVFRYCLAECCLLVELCDKLREALDNAQIHTTGWYGAGCIAASILRQSGIREHHRHDQGMPSHIRNPIAHAYFGGRVETFGCGWVGPTYGYDIRSAYPSSAIHLPSLAEGEWKRVTTFREEYDHGLYRVEWDTRGSPVVPFPFRWRKENWYVSRGIGWYHAAEVAAALRAFGANAIRVGLGYVYIPGDSVRPFAAPVREYWAERKRVRDSDPGAYKVIKLGLNSLYGKLAQGVSRTGTGHDTLPRYQSYFWAGEITARTRARVLDLVSAGRDSILSIATDGMLFREDMGFACGDDLGDLEPGGFDRVLIVQPGLYLAEDNDGQQSYRTRGFMSREIDWHGLRKSYEERGASGYVRNEVTRFVGLGAAIQLRKPKLWRTWHTSTRELTFHNMGKADDSVGPARSRYGAWIPFYPWDRPFSKRREAPLMSAPYKPRDFRKDARKPNPAIELMQADMDSPTPLLDT